MIISHRKKFIFFACGKTGTTSVESVLRPYEDADDLLVPLKKSLAAAGHNPKHVRPERAREFIPDEMWREYFKFVFVRNPWDWVVSQYFFDRALRKRPAAPVLMLTRKNVEKVWRRTQNFNQNAADESYMQYPFVYSAAHGRMVDFIGCYERIQADFDAVCRCLDIPRSLLPVRNVSGHRPYRKLYTPRARARVAQLYEKDIRLLGYSFSGTPSRDFLNPQLCESAGELICEK